MSKVIEQLLTHQSLGVREIAKWTLSQTRYQFSWYGNDTFYFTSSKAIIFIVLWTPKDFIRVYINGTGLTFTSLTDLFSYFDTYPE